MMATTAKPAAKTVAKTVAKTAKTVVKPAAKSAKPAAKPAVDPKQLALDLDDPVKKRGRPRGSRNKLRFDKPMTRSQRERMEREALPNPKMPDDLQTIDASYLGKLIGRSTRSIKNDTTRRPESLPPRFELPGKERNRYLWRVVDVRAWMEALAQVQAEERVRARDFARKQGIPTPSGCRINLANVTKRKPVKVKPG